MKREEIKKDLNKLVEDITTYIVNKEQNQYLKPLQYRLGLIEEKYERAGFIMSSSENSGIEKDLQFAKAILY